MAELALDRLERWFLEIVTHPDGVAAGERSAQASASATIDEILLPSQSLTASERVGIYAGMYYGRLIEVLEEDFPALVALLGEDAPRILGAFLAAHPSSHQNLNQLGRLLPAFVQSEASDVPWRPFASEVARLERDVQEVFDARENTPLATDDLLAVKPEDWGGLRLTASAALRLQAFAHPTNAWYQSWKDDELLPAPDPGPSWLALYRKDFRVWRLPLTNAEHTLLAALVAGQPLEQALMTLASTLGSDLSEFGTSLRTWLRDWTGLGFFAGAKQV